MKLSIYPTKSISNILEATGLKKINIFSKIDGFHYDKTKKVKIKGGFVMVDRIIIAEKRAVRLTGCAHAVHNFIVEKCAGNNVGNKGYTINQKRIGIAIGYSLQAVCQAVKQLKEKGLILVETNG